MRIPLNVLLYQLSANSIYENQNIDLTCSFDGVQLFDQTQLAGTYENELYLVADQVLLTELQTRISSQTVRSCVSVRMKNSMYQIFHPAFPWFFYIPMSLFRLCSIGF